MAADEVPVYAGLVNTMEPPPDLWQRIAAHCNIRLLTSNVLGCVFAAPKDRAAQFAELALSGWARLSLRRLG